MPLERGRGSGLPLLCRQPQDENTLAWLSLIERVAVLFNPATAPFAGLMMRAMENTAPALAVTVREAPVKDDAEIDVAMAGIAREERSGLVVLPESFTASHRNALVAAAARHRVPAVYSDPAFA